MSVSDMELKECHSLIYPDFTLVDFVISYKEASGHSQIKDKLISTSLLKLLINCASCESLTVSIECTITYKHSPARLAYFQQLIETRTLLNPSLKSSEDIDSTIQKFTSDIQEYIHLATTPSTIHPNNLLPNYIKSLLREKRKAKSRQQRHKYPIDKHTYNQLNNKLMKAL
ncbi:hypothetical protein QTP88_016527 [Uroleucon formosanum]